MPTYRFRDKITGAEHEEFMTIASCEDYLCKNPQIQTVPVAPAIVSGVDSSRAKPAEDFRSLLKKMKKEHPNGKINTFG